MKNPFSPIRVSIIVLTILLFFGCDKDNIGPSLFTLFVSTDATKINDEFFVVFACNDASFPEVTVNGYKLEKLYIKGSVVSGNMLIPASDTVRFEVKLNGKATTGILIAPSFVDKMYCNNKILKNRTSIGYNKDIHDYHFKWDTVHCEQYIFETGNVTPERRVFLECSINEYTFTYPEIDNVLTFDFSVSNGDRLDIGEEPSFSGDYGRGFCNIVKSIRYTVDKYGLSPKSVKLQSQKSQNNEELYQKHVMNFMEYLDYER